MQSAFMNKLLDQFSHRYDAIDTIGIGAACGETSAHVAPIRVHESLCYAIRHLVGLAGGKAPICAMELHLFAAQYAIDEAISDDSKGEFERTLNDQDVFLPTVEVSLLILQGRVAFVCADESRAQLDPARSQVEKASDIPSVENTARRNHGNRNAMLFRVARRDRQDILHNSFQGNV